MRGWTIERERNRSLAPLHRNNLAGGGGIPAIPQSKTRKSGNTDRKFNTGPARETLLACGPAGTVSEETRDR